MSTFRELIREFTPSWLVPPSDYADTEPLDSDIQPDDRIAAERLARDADIAWEDVIENERMSPRAALRAARRN